MKEIYAKDTGMSDLDWSELAEKNGLTIHPDQLRKMGAGIRLAVEAGMLNPNADTIQTPIPDRHELQKLRDLRAEINTAYRADARSEALREAVVQAAASLTTIEIPSSYGIHQDAPRSLVLAMGDFHFGRNGR